MHIRRRRIYHKAKLVAENGDVSPVCADPVPKAIDMKKASWTIQWDEVTCRACLRRKPKEGEVICVVHCKKAVYDIYIGRPGKWGNPFAVGRDGSRNEVIQKYREWIMTQPDLLAALPELRGKVLGCWCRPAACHGDVLKELAEGT